MPPRTLSAAGRTGPSLAAVNVRPSSSSAHQSTIIALPHLITQVLHLHHHVAQLLLSFRPHCFTGHLASSLDNHSSVVCVAASHHSFPSIMWNRALVAWLLLLAIAASHFIAVVALAPGTELNVFPNAPNYQFSSVEAVAVDGAGNIYVADWETIDNGGSGRVVVLSSTGALLHVFPNASSSVASGYSFEDVESVAMDRAGNIYVADYQSSDNGGQGRVVVLSSTGALLYAFPNASSSVASNYRFDGVFGVALDGVGNIYVADSGTSDNGGTGRVVVLSPTGALLHAFPNASSPAASSYSFDYV